MSRSQEGGFLAITAFVLWGAFPFYFKAVAHISPLEVLANRIIWAAIFLLLLLVFLKRYWRVLGDAINNKQRLAYLCLSTLFIVTNWGVYIWAVYTDRLFEASIGYYINPLLNIFLGFALLKEQLSRLQWLAVALAAMGVGLQLVALGKLPWISLVLAASFAFYGFIHKKIAIDSIPGLFIEACLLLPVALIFLLCLTWVGSPGWPLSSEANVTLTAGPLTWSNRDWLLLIAAGPITITPLLLFTAAAKRIAYSSLGFLQYITPSMLFLLALFYYKEPFSLIKLITFLLIWVALFILSIDLLKKRYYKKADDVNVV